MKISASVRKRHATSAIMWVTSKRWRSRVERTQARLSDHLQASGVDTELVNNEMLMSSWQYIWMQSAILPSMKNQAGSMLFKINLRHLSLRSLAASCAPRFAARDVIIEAIPLMKLTLWIYLCLGEIKSALSAKLWINFSKSTVSSKTISINAQSAIRYKTRQKDSQ